MFNKSCIQLKIRRRAGHYWPTSIQSKQHTYTKPTKHNKNKTTTNANKTNATISKLHVYSFLLSHGLKTAIRLPIHQQQFQQHKNLYRHAHHCPNREIYTKKYETKHSRMYKAKSYTKKRILKLHQHNQKPHLYAQQPPKQNCSNRTDTPSTHPMKWNTNYNHPSPQYNILRANPLNSFIKL